MTLTLAQRLLAAFSLAMLLGCAILAYLVLANQGQEAALGARLPRLQATLAQTDAAEPLNANDPLLRAPAFPRDPPDLALASAVLSSATGSGVSSGSIQTTEGGTERIGSNTYRVTTLSLTISGTLPQILNFFDRMEQAGLKTIVFDNMRLETSSGRSTVRLQIVAYAQAE